jgi:MFS family permease
MHLYASLCISLRLSASLCISLHLYASLCVSLYLSASLCVSLHLSASLCIPLYPSVSQVTILFPFLVFMVKDFNLTDDDKKLGYFVGILGSGFMFGRLLTSYAWGSFADHYGRRPVFYIGITSVMITSIAFGFSFNYYWALTFRILSGIMNGVTAVAKACSSELAPTPELQAKGMVIVGGTWSFGIIFGSSIGGILANITSYGIFGQFPYLIAMMVNSSICVLALIAVRFWMPETLNKKSNAHNSLSVTTTEARATTAVININKTDDDDHHHHCGHTDRQSQSDSQSLNALTSVVVLQKEGSLSLTGSGPCDRHGHGTSCSCTCVELDTMTMTSQTGKSVPEELSLLRHILSDSDESYDYIDNDNSNSNHQSNDTEDAKHHIDTRSHTNQHAQYSVIYEADCKRRIGERDINTSSSPGGRCSVDSASSAAPGIDDADTDTAQVHSTTTTASGARTSKWQVLSQPKVRMSIIVYTVLSLVGIAYDESYSLWASTSADIGGLGFDSTKIGISLAMSGSINIIGTVFVFPPIANRFGPLRTMRMMLLISIPSLALMPHVSTLAQHTDTVAMWIVLTLLSAIRNVTVTACFTSIMLIINNSVTADYRGSVNGLAMQVGSLAKASGPALAGAIFAWSLTNDIGYPFDAHLIYYIIAIGTIGVYIASLALPVELDQPPHEPGVRVRVTLTHTDTDTDTDSDVEQGPGVDVDVDVDVDADADVDVDVGVGVIRMSHQIPLTTCTLPMSSPYLDADPAAAASTTLSESDSESESASESELLLL